MPTGAVSPDRRGDKTSNESRLKFRKMFDRLTPAVKNLLIRNVLVFMAQTMLPWGGRIDDLFALHTFGSDKFSLFQIVTSIFMHGSVGHLFVNMFALWMFGSILENDIGTRRFLVYYFVCGIGGGILHDLVLMWQFDRMAELAQAFFDNPSNSLLVDFLSKYGDGIYSVPSFDGASPDSYPLVQGGEQAVRELLRLYNDRTTVGASGAVFGVLLAFGMMHPNDRIMLLIPPIPMKAKYFVLAYGLLELMLGITDNDNIAHFAHLGGMLFGFILLTYWRRRGGLYRHIRWN